MTEKDVVKVYTTVNEEEMVVIKSLLDDADIQYYVEGEDGRAIYGFSQGMFNEMHIFVNRGDEEDVKKILEVMSQGVDLEEITKLSEEDEGWENECGCQSRED